MKHRDLERRAALAAANGDLAQAAGLLEKVADSPWRTLALARIYDRLALEAPDPRTRLRLDREAAGGWWQKAWSRAHQIINRAWRAFETADGPEPLRRALVEVRASLEVWPHQAALGETEARLLMRLGRDEEAFAVAMRLSPAPELADVRASLAYQAWCEQNFGHGARFAAA